LNYSQLIAIIMARGQPIPPVVQWIIIRLATIMKWDIVAAYTGVSLRSVEHILSHFNKTGTVNTPPEDKETIVKHHLTDYDTRVLFLTSGY
jgi:hypothetical protein